MNSQSIKFLLVGISNTIVGYGTFYLCIYLFDLHYSIALLISHIIGVFNSYVWNNRWTFNNGSTTRGKLIKFILVYLFTFLLNLVLLAFFRDYLGIKILVAQLISLVLTTILSFFGHKYISFGSQSSKGE